MIELLLKKVFKSCLQNPSELKYIVQGGNNDLIQKFIQFTTSPEHIEHPVASSRCRGRLFNKHVWPKFFNTRRFANKESLGFAGVSITFLVHADIKIS